MSIGSETYPVAPARPGAFSLLTALGSRLRCGSLRLTFPDGSCHESVAPEPGPNAALVVRNRRLVRRILFGGDTGFAEAYMDGDCDSPDIAAVVELALHNWEHWQREMAGMTWYRIANRLLHLAQPNSKQIAKKNIARHYDLGNAFYEAWLDPGMTYSSAIFEEPGQSLDDAQTAKYRRIAARAGLEPGHHVLEIGCGWGGFVVYAAREIGCRVTGITISKAQHDYAVRRVREEGLEHLVELRRQDYRDVTEQFDRIVSIEMFEAVGERYWPDFFRALRARLSPDGRAALQVITIADTLWEGYRGGSDFIQRYIFPGGLLPAMAPFRARAAEAGLTCRDEAGFGADYARTLAEWHARFDAAWPQISAMGFDERFRRMWKYYLAYCQGGFRTDRIDVRHLVLEPA